MINLKKISSVAVYERKTLFRSWLFKIFSLLTLITLFILNMAVFANEWAHWVHRAIPANLPLINVLYVNVAQAVIAVFLASEFIKQDKKLDTTEVIYARPISNGEYVVGKIFGILILFVGLVLMVLLMALIFNIIIKDTPVVWNAYFLYPLLITIPTLIYILGLSFFLMVIFRSQALTFLVLLGYIALTLFYFEDRLHGTLDYMAFNLPMVYSDIIHFSDFKAIALQRGSYLLLGLAFIFATIRFMGRLPQVGKLNFINTSGFLICLITGLSLLWIYFKDHDLEKKERDRFLSLNDQYVAMKTVDILSNDLYLEQQGSGIVAKANLRFRNLNSEALDTIIFSMNPGLIIDSITSSRGKVSFQRKDQILMVFPGETLNSLSRGSYTFYYHGSPVDHVSCLDIPVREREALRKVHLATVDKKASVIDGNYLLLTPEILWYPIAGVTFNKVNFLPGKVDFSKFRLEVKPRDGYVPVSSGEVITNDSTYIFINKNDLNGIALAIAEFEKRSMMIDEVEYNLYLMPGHDFFSIYIDSISDTLSYIIKEEKENYEYDELDLYYNFDRINLVETPVHFHAYERPYTTSTEYIHPEMILLPERGSGLQSLDFKRGIKSIERLANRRNNERSEEEIQLDVFRRLLKSTFFNTGTTIYRNPFNFNAGTVRLIDYKTKFNYKSNPYCVFPLYYNKIAAISSSEYPIFNTMIQQYLRDGFDVSFRESFRGGITERERANLALKGNTITDVFSQRGNNIIASVIDQASAFVIQAIQNKVGAEEFDYFLYYYIEDHAFSEITLEQFNDDFYAEFGIDPLPYLNILNSKTNLASFLLSDPDYSVSRDEFGDVYIVRMKISNTGESLGLINFSFRLPGQGGFGGGGPNTEERIFEIPEGETREVQMIFYAQPRMMTVNTLISENIPSSFSLFLRSAVNESNISMEEYEQIVDEPVSRQTENEIIIDNEDPGFSQVSVSNESKLKQFIDSKMDMTKELGYQAINPNWTPPVWTAFAHSAFYGKSIRSALIARKGDGNNVARWTAILPEAGFYEVYTYIPVPAMFKRPSVRQRGEGGQNRRQSGGRPSGPEFADKGTEYIYTISSNEGSEQVTMSLDNISEGWNSIGTFHFPADTATIELGNDCVHGFRVVADAIKLVKKD